MVINPWMLIMAFQHDTPPFPSQAHNLLAFLFLFQNHLAKRDRLYSVAHNYSFFFSCWFSEKGQSFHHDSCCFLWPGSSPLLWGSDPDVSRLLGLTSSSLTHPLLGYFRAFISLWLFSRGYSSLVSLSQMPVSELEAQYIPGCPPIRPLSPP